MGLPMTIGRLVASSVQSMESMLTKVGPPWMEVLLAGLKFILNLVRRPKPETASKEASHE
jgi:hypothetical protein